MGQRIRRYIKRALAATVVLAALLWSADWLLLRRTIARNGEAFGEVEVHYRFAIHLKNKRIEQSPTKTRVEECVHSMFPHYDEQPCWYLARHTEQLQTLDGGRWHFWYEE
jgi:hypothetical protein